MISSHKTKEIDSSNKMIPPGPTQKKKLSPPKKKTRPWSARKGGDTRRPKRGGRNHRETREELLCHQHREEATGAKIGDCTRTSIHSNLPLWEKKEILLKGDCGRKAKRKRKTGNIERGQEKYATKKKKLADFTKKKSGYHSEKGSTELGRI